TGRGLGMEGRLGQRDLQRRAGAGLLSTERRRSHRARREGVRGRVVQRLSDGNDNLRVRRGVVRNADGEGRELYREGWNLDRPDRVRHGVQRLRHDVVPAGAEVAANGTKLDPGTSENLPLARLATARRCVTLAP